MPSCLRAFLLLRARARPSKRGDLVWASDVTVDDLRPALGQRFMFVHHGDCEHHLTISDIRLDPLPPSMSAVPTYAAEQRTTCARNAALPEEGRGAPALPPHPRPDTIDTRSGGGGAAGGVAGEGGVDAAGGGNVGEGRRSVEVLDSGCVDEGYPRLTFRVKPNVRRCSICTAMAASYKSFGHPLADEVRDQFMCSPVFALLEREGVRIFLRKRRALVFKRLFVSVCVCWFMIVLRV